MRHLQRCAQRLYRRLPVVWRLTFLGTTLTIVGLVVPRFWMLVVAGGIVFLYALWKAKPRPLQAAFLGLFWGLGTSGASIWWFWSVLPLDWTGVSGLASLALVGVTWVAGTIALSLPYLLGAPLLVSFRNTPFAPVLTGILWPLLETARMCSFALLVLSSQSALEPYFSISALGVSLAEQGTLLQFASIGGVYALSALYGVLIGSIAWLWYKPHGIGIYLSGALLVGIVITPFFLSYKAPAAERTVTVGLVTLTAPPEARANSAFLVPALASLVHGPHVDVLAFPEGYSLRETQENLFAFQKLFGFRESLIVQSGFASSTDTTGYGTLSYVSSTQGVIAVHEKTLLVPVGEYMPPVLQAFFKLIDAQVVNRYIENRFAHKTLRGNSVAAVPFNGIRVGALLCSEILSPTLYKTLGADGADVLINVANNAWFHDSQLVYRKLIELSKIHAVENRRFFLAASNGSPSFVVDPSGALIKETSWGYAGILFAQIPVPAR